MIYGIASLVFIPLLAMAIPHLLWSFGSTYPVKDSEALARAVVGRTGIARMQPRLISFLNGAFIFASGIWALALADPAPNTMLTIGGAVIAVIYLARGMAGFLPQWRAAHAEEPFAGLDKRLYSPVCLGVGAGITCLTLLRAW